MKIHEFFVFVANFYVILKAMWNTMEFKKDSSNSALGEAKEIHWEQVSHLDQALFLRKVAKFVSGEWTLVTIPAKSLSNLKKFFRAMQSSQK